MGPLHVNHIIRYFIKSLKFVTTFGKLGIVYIIWTTSYLCSDDEGKGPYSPVLHTIKHTIPSKVLWKTDYNGLM